MRRVVEDFAHAYHTGTREPSGPTVTAAMPTLERQCATLHEELINSGAMHYQSADAAQHGESIADKERHRSRPYVPPSTWQPLSKQEQEQPRSFVACVFCARLDWSENRRMLFIGGENSFIKNRQAVAELLSADKYAAAWPLIPREELGASSVEFAYENEEKETQSIRVLMHTRRVPRGAETGMAPVCVCHECFSALAPAKPKMPKYALANFLWLGRHHKLFRQVGLGYQLLLPLGRVVSTKVYLSSKGVDQQVRQERTKHRRKNFLQSGMQGTAIVFGNASTSKEMAQFPPEPDDLQDKFAAVFTGPENPTEEEQMILDGIAPGSDKKREAMAREAMKREVEFQVNKKAMMQWQSF